METDGCSLVSLSTELLMSVFKYLDHVTMARVSLACKSLRVVSRDNRLWFAYTKRIHASVGVPFTSNNPSETSWFDYLRYIKTGYLFVLYDSSSRRWNITWGHTRSMQSGVMIGPFSSLREAIAMNYLGIQEVEKLRDFVIDVKSQIDCCIVPLVAILGKILGARYTWLYPINGSPDHRMTWYSEVVTYWMKFGDPIEVSVREFLLEKGIFVTRNRSSPPRKERNRDKRPYLN